MNRYLWFVLMFMNFSHVNAHDINTASITFHKTEGYWRADLSFPRAAADYALMDYLALSTGSLTEEEFKKELIAYIKKHINLRIDGKDYLLGIGGIKLGNHQSNVRFFIPEWPNEYESLELQISLFKENKDQHTKIKIVEGSYEVQKILHHSNNYKVSLIKSESALIESDESYQNTYMLGGVFILLTVVGGFIFYVKS